MKRFALLVAIAAVVVGCKSAYVTTNTNTHETSRDSVRMEYAHVYDTLHVYDTTRIVVYEESNQREHTDVQFGVGGGTYNTRTGEATNVVGVTASAELNQVRTENQTLARELTQAHASIDSLSACITEMEHTNVQTQNVERVRTGWDSFLLWWFIATALYIVIRVAWWAFRTFYLRM